MQQPGGQDKKVIASNNSIFEKIFFMKTNMGKADKTIRILLALVFAVLVYTDIVTGIAAYVLLVLTAIFLLTSIINFCPLYKLFGIDTCRRQHT
jgi:hypothetical protein